MSGAGRHRTPVAHQLQQCQPGRISCRQPEHRVLGAESGLPQVDNVELALFYRPDATSAQLALAAKLRHFCQLS